MRKRVLAILLSLCMLLGMLPMTAMAAEETISVKIDDIASEYDAVKSITLSKYVEGDTKQDVTDIVVDSEGSYVVPVGATMHFTVKYAEDADTNGTPMAAVTAYYEDASCSNLSAQNNDFTLYTTSAAAGKNMVIKIDGLTYYKLDDNGTLTFAGSGKLTSHGNPISYGKQPYNGGSITVNKIVIAEGITEIGRQVFAYEKWNCPWSDVTTISFPNTLTLINNYCFRKCNTSSTDFLQIPSSVQFIGEYSIDSFADSTQTACVQIDLTKLSNTVQFHENAFKSWDSGKGIIYIDGTNISTSTLAELKINNNINIATTNGGLFNEETVVAVNTLAIPEKTGYIGKWYYKDSNGVEQETTNGTLINDVKSYYAKWLLKAPIAVEITADKDIIEKNTGTTTLTASASHELKTGVEYEYQWYNGETAIPDATSDTYTAAGLTADTTFTCKVKAKDSNDLESSEVTSNEVTIKVAGAEGSIDINETELSATYDDASVAFTYTTADGMTDLDVTSSNTDVATVSHDAATKTVTVSIVSAGTANITVSYAGGEDFTAASDTVTLIVEKATPTLTLKANGTESLSLRGSNTVAFTVDGIPTDDSGTLSVDCDKTVDLKDNGDGTFTVSLPNQTADYIFTATVTYDDDDNYNTASDDCTVSVTRKKSGSSNSGSSSTTTTNDVSVDSTDNGSIKLSDDEAKKGETVTITVTPDAGYELDKLTVTDSKGNEIKVKDNGDGTFTFTMPDSEVEIEAEFKVAADEQDDTIVLTIGSTVAMVGETPVVNDVAPIIKGERTMLPIRFIAEALGATVDWNEANQLVTITKGETVIEIFIGQPFALVNGEPVQLDAPAFIENDRTYLPLRFVAENLGATVEWDGTTNTVTIIPNK